VVDIIKCLAQKGMFLWISIMAKVCNDMYFGFFIICELKSFVQQFLKDPIGLEDRHERRVKI